MKSIIKNSLAVLLLLASGSLFAADDADMRGAGAPASDGTGLVRRGGPVTTAEIATADIATKLTPILRAFGDSKTKDVLYDADTGTLHVRDHYAPASETLHNLGGITTVATIIALAALADGKYNAISTSLSMDPPLVCFIGVCFAAIILAGTWLTVKACDKGHQATYINKFGKQDSFAIDAKGITHYGRVWPWQTTAPRPKTFIAWADIKNVESVTTSGPSGYTTNVLLTFIDGKKTLNLGTDLRMIQAIKTCLTVINGPEIPPIE